MESFLGINRFMIRLTDDKTISQIETLIRSWNPHKYIIGSELSTQGKRHYHIYYEGVCERSALKQLINDAGYKGNHMYNLKPADNSSKVKRYCIKDGDFLYHNIDPQLMDTWKQLAHKKVKDGYSSELTALEEKYITGNMYSWNNFGTDILMLKVAYGLKPDRHNHVKYMNYMRIKKEGKPYASQLNAEFLQK